MKWEDFKEQLKAQSKESRTEIEREEVICALQAQVINASEKLGISPRKLWRLIKIQGGKQCH